MTWHLVVKFHRVIHPSSQESSSPRTHPVCMSYRRVTLTQVSLTNTVLSSGIVTSCHILSQHNPEVRDLNENSLPTTTTTTTTTSITTSSITVPAATTPPTLSDHPHRHGDRDRGVGARNKTVGVQPTHTPSPPMSHGKTSGQLRNIKVILVVRLSQM